MPKPTPHDLQEYASELIDSVSLHVITSPLFEGNRSEETLRMAVEFGDLWNCEQFEKNEKVYDGSSHVYQIDFHGFLLAGMKINKACGGVIISAAKYWESVNEASPLIWDGVISIVRSKTMEPYLSQSYRRSKKLSQGKNYRPDRTVLTALQQPTKTNWSSWVIPMPSRSSC